MKNFKHYHLSNIKWYYFFVCCTFIVLWTSKVSQLLFVPTNTEIITKHIFQVISNTTHNNCWICIWTQTTRLLSDQIIYIKKEFVGNLFSRPRIVKRKIMYRKVSIVGFNITFLSRSNADNFIWSIASHTNWFSFINAIWQI